MRIIDLTIRDFGVYCGTNTFDLKPRQGNIVIFGGKNGSGKTTILEAIRLCLYGRMAVGERITQKAYDAYIAERMHQKRKSAIGTNYTSVSLRFEYAQLNGAHLYEVTRAWKKRSNSISEQIVVYEDGKMLTEMAEERWQDFIEDIVPHGIAKLFFFDGEKIQSLASDKLSEQALGDEINRLLGLNLVIQLHADLDNYMYRQRKSSAAPELANKLELMQEERDALEDQYQAQRQDRSQTHSNVELILGKIEEIERRLSQESSGFAFVRNELEQKVNRLNIEIDQTEKDIQNLVSGLLPFSYVPELVDKLKSQLKDEAQYQQWHASKKILSSRLEEIQKKINATNFWEQFTERVQLSTQTQIVEQIDQMLSELLNVPERYQNFVLHHQVSGPERIQLLGWIEQTRNEIPKQAFNLGENLEMLTRQRDEATKRLHKVPDNDILKPLVSEINNLHEKYGQLIERENKQLEEERRLRNLLDDSNRKLRKAYDAFRGSEALEKRLLLVSNVQDVLDDFLGRLTRQKILELEKLLTARFRELSRKPDIVHRVVISPHSFRITLYGEGDRPILKEHLSAGEKQMLAISILWALRQLSRRPFPVVIDTPLGRLDSEHRNNLIQQYFPLVSHQVILFSTDTEVDQEYFKALKPHISHAYHLEYDPSIGATKYHEGYFWDEVDINAAEPN